jgi:hypothetical protein
MLALPIPIDYYQGRALRAGADASALAIMEAAAMDGGPSLRSVPTSEHRDSVGTRGFVRGASPGVSATDPTRT